MMDIDKAHAESEKLAYSRALMMIDTMPISQFFEIEYHKPKNDLGHIVEFGYKYDGTLISIAFLYNEMELKLIPDVTIEIDCYLHEVTLSDSFIDQNNLRLLNILKSDILTYLCLWFRSRQYPHIRKHFTAGPCTIDTCLSHESLTKLKRIEPISDVVIQGELDWEDMQASYQRELNEVMKANI